MARDWENTFRSWASPPGKTEQEKCENAERAIKKAKTTSEVLNQRNVTVFQQGSYRNRTNVRTESDVDICMLCADSIFFDLPDGMTYTDFGIVTPADYSYSNYKMDVENALVSYFGRDAVTRGNKAFDVHENTYRIDADVVACFEYRWYQHTGTYRTGVAFLTDQGQQIVNWPNQNYQNGVAKNEATSRGFKALVRILKNLRNEMKNNGISAANSVPGYLIECLTWNVPNEGFSHDTYTSDVRWTLAHLFNNTPNDADCKEWCEINDIKYLFHISQPWTRIQANSFLGAAWDYIGFT